MKTNIKNSILILNFEGNKQRMNNVLDPISNLYEGVINNREGHNFPVDIIPKGHILEKFKSKCKYVIGIYNNKSIKHELLHAEYYINEEYKKKVNKEWEELKPKVREHIIGYLKKLGYPDHVIIDEYQAYRYTEAANFFGIKLI